MTTTPPREQLPPLRGEAALDERIKTLMQQCGHPESTPIYSAFKQFQNEMELEMIAYAREALRARAASVEAVALFDCAVKPRPLSYSLHDYHRAMSEGPLNFTWQDKPHRLVYDLIAALRYYATPAHIPADVSPPQAPQAVVQDTARLDALARPGWELSQNNDPECFPEELWQVHRVSGGRNDREWTLIGQGDSPRAAIDSALATKGQQA